jgi:DNA/RNA-binding domain of Phe-tRNA-synthetase-like protein
MKIIITENKRDRLVLNWLNKEFGNLTEVVRGDKTIYVDQNGLKLFYYYQDSKNRSVYINYNRIWIFFESIFGLDYSQTQKILKLWLEETYNLRGYTPEILPLILDK